MIRAIIDGKEVFGWCVMIDEEYFLVPEHATTETSFHNTNIYGARVIDISLCAESTGRKDKHGVEIYGSKGDMKGGDRVQGCTSKDVRTVLWDKYGLTWAVRTRNRSGCVPLREYDMTGHEIIPRKEDK